MIVGMQIISNFRERERPDWGALFRLRPECCDFSTCGMAANTLILAIKAQLAHAPFIMGTKRPTTNVIGEAGHL